MYRVFKCLWAFALATLVSHSVGGATFRLEDGDVFEGTAVVPPEDGGLVIQLSIGGFSQRIPWNRFDQETVKEMAKDPRLQPFVEPFIDLTPEQFQRTLPQRNQPITIRDVPRLERPAHPGIFSGIATTGGLLLLGIFYLANLFAAYEVAVFRRQPIILVCGVSLVLPVIGQIVFLSLPTIGAAETEAAHDHGPAPAAEAAPSGAPASGLGLAAVKETPNAAKDSLEGSVFKRGTVTFDRRFFETKLAGFFRVTLAEPERSLSIVVRGGGKEIVAARISRISFNEVAFQLANGGESGIGFAEIQEVLVRKK